MIGLQVREKDLSVVVSTLKEEFSIYQEVKGESVPVRCQDVTNGLQKNGKEGALEKKKTLNASFKLVRLDQN